MKNIILFRCLGLLLTIFLGTFLQFFFFADDKDEVIDVLLEIPLLWFFYTIVGFGVAEHLHKLTENKK
jgi:uncharacterized membrane protein YbhN (UPF0104 family)